MKVYEGSIHLKEDYKKVPQIIIRNKKLKNCGFDIGKQFAVLYQPGRITLVVISNDKNLENC